MDAAQATRPSRGRLAAHVLLYATLALAPLPLAGNRPWSWSALALVVGTACLIWGVSAVRHREIVVVHPRRTMPLVLAFGAYLLWCALQASPWLPEAWANDAWGRAELALGRDLAGRVAVDPAAAVETVMRLMTYAGVFWLSLHFARNTSAARRILWVVAMSGFVYAVYGLAAHLSGSGTILWYAKWHYVDSLTSTFVNRNSYATYAGLAVLTSLTLLIDRARQLRVRLRPSAYDLLRAIDRMGFGGWFLVTAMVVGPTALLLSQSRGGFAAFVAGMTGFLLSLRLGPDGRRAWGLPALLLGLGLMGLLVFSGEQLAGRLGDLVAGEQVERRAELYALTARQIGEHPWAGIGLGGFDNLYHAERTAAFGTTVTTFVRAHNSYMEVALEAGLPAFILLSLVLGVLVARCLLGAARRRRNAVFPCLGVGASVLAGAHSLIDFSLQIPAVSVTFAALLGVGVAQSWRHGHHGRGPVA